MAIQFTPEQKAAYRKNYAPGATNDLFELFILECERRELIPGEDVVFQTRTEDSYNHELHRTVAVTKPAFITTVVALRKLAAKTGQMNGYGKFKWHYKTGDIIESFDIPQGRTPHAATVEIYRKDWEHPAYGYARWDAYVQKDSNAQPTHFWAHRGEEQLAKCAEALALRTIAPEVVAGLLIDEELQNERREPAASSVGTGGLEPTITPVPVVIPAPTIAPVVNQDAATVALPVSVQNDPSITGVSNASPVTPPPVAAAPVRPGGPPKRPTPPPAITPAVPVIPNRLPQPERPAHESISELKNVADAVARDKDPVHTQETLVARTSPFPEGTKVPQVDTTPPIVQTSPGKVEFAPVPVAANTDGRATREELAAFKNRAGKLMHDKLEKEAGLKGASALLRDYILKQGEQPSLEKILKVKWEEILVGLETATPENASNLVKENK